MHVQVCVCFKPPGGTRYQEIQQDCTGLYSISVIQPAGPANAKKELSVLYFLELSAVRLFISFYFLSFIICYDKHKRQLSNMKFAANFIVCIVISVAYSIFLMLGVA